MLLRFCGYRTLAIVSRNFVFAAREFSPLFIIESIPHGRDQAFEVFEFCRDPTLFVRATRALIIHTYIRISHSDTRSRANFYHELEASIAVS